MREELIGLCMTKRLQRITPAHAGRISLFSFLFSALRDHPRACGKNIINGSSTCLSRGSPPRMREEFHLVFPRYDSSRITPAHAGRIWDYFGFPTGIEDHPRACGKNSILALYVSAPMGSPPRMREESKLETLMIVQAGITPAHAGRIIRRDDGTVTFGDHPRACGKNALVVLLLVPLLGSPPRMREELRIKGGSKNCTGITPAHAGRISIAAAMAVSIEDHPRACGKNLQRLKSNRTTPGSPPRMREESIG